MDPELLEKLKSALASMSEMINTLQEAMPGDSAKEQADTVDQATDEELVDQDSDPMNDGSGEDAGAEPDMTDEDAAPADVSGGEEDPTKKLKKAAAAAMIKKSLPI